MKEYTWYDSCCRKNNFHHQFTMDTNALPWRTILPYWTRIKEGFSRNAEKLAIKVAYVLFVQQPSSLVLSLLTLTIFRISIILRNCYAIIWPFRLFLVFWCSFMAKLHKLSTFLNIQTLKMLNLGHCDCPMFIIATSSTNITSTSLTIISCSSPFSRSITDWTNSWFVFAN